jgi:hypothetical protein
MFIYKQDFSKYFFITFKVSTIVCNYETEVVYIKWLNKVMNPLTIFYIW